MNNVKESTIIMRALGSISVVFILSIVFLVSDPICEVRASVIDDLAASLEPQSDKREVRVSYPSQGQNISGTRPIQFRYNPHTKYGRERNLLFERRQRKPKYDAPPGTVRASESKPRSVSYRNASSSAHTRSRSPFSAIKRSQPAAATRSPRIMEGVASWYGRDFHGRQTSNGEIYNMFKRTAAHRVLPFDTHVRVTNLTNGRSTIVRINDRGPFVPGRDIDLSYRAAYEIGMIDTGVEDVRMEIIGDKPD